MATNSKVQRSPCSSQLKNFYYAVKKRETWALRMLDSSGTPKNGFVWGNNYWLGTYSQCRWTSSKQALLPAKEISAKDPEFPPFSVDFFIGSFKHNSNYQAKLNVSKEDLILIGLCLPSVCSVDELKPLFESWAAQNPLTVQFLYNFTMKLNNVRMIELGTADDFPLSISLSLIIGTAISLVIFATLYDIYIWRPLRKQCECIRMTQGNTWAAGKIRNIRGSDELLNRDNNLNDGYELKIDNSLHKSIPTGDNSQQPQTPPVRRNHKKLLRKLFVCFSAVSNTQAIVLTHYDKEIVPAIHGLRFFGMVWIICLYTVYYLKDFADNKPLLLRISQGFTEQVISNTTFSVDTFFFTSGFLLSYIYFRNRRGSSRANDGCSIKKKVNEFGSMLLNRVIRLTPVYAVVLITANISIKRNGRRSLFELSELSQNTCGKYWWRNLLYINNLYKAEEMCMSWSWYLSTEMQFFVLGFTLLIIYSRYRKLAACLTGGLIMCSALINGYLSYSYGLAPTLDHQLSSLYILHYPPWTRVVPYLIGICTGYFAIHLKGKLKCNKATLITCWLVGPICNLWALFGLYNKDMSVISTALYSALSRPAWGLGLAWIVISCATDNAGILKGLLSFKGWIPLSRLSLTAYLLSPLIINLTYSSSETPIHLDFFPVVVYFSGFVSITYFCAFILSLMVELPFNQMGKCLFRRRQEINQLNQQ
ncbi:UNVERIFIED_CONTAM: hypothetical protein PYX00_003766 [Menopon gallinae]|uniref:Nose resistant-to-fluoxetine protein N-terminal domain-containing protein n=1 Tax=Menopon gallinae TaxID=328185 RepID=A0AAW2I1K8_9NEOP